MRLHRLLLLGLPLGLLVAGGPLAAQRRVVVNGLAYDSLHSRPLENAFIGIAGTARSTTSDSRGRFHFDSIVPGPYTFTMQHDVLDSVGFSGITAKAVVTDGRDEVRVAVPSFSTLWRFACGTRVQSADSGLVFGTVRDAEHDKVVSDAAVEASWVDLASVGKTGVKQRRYHAETRTDAKGGYGICGVPVGITVQMHATAAGAASGVLDLRNPLARVQRMDLTVATVIANQMGVVTGRVLGPAGQPVLGARVVVDTLPEVRTLADGRFIVRNVPVGTRQVEAQNIGMGQSMQGVEVKANDTSFVTVQLKMVATLEAVHVTAPERVQRLVQEINDRRKLGMGTIIDSTKIMHDHSIRGTFGTVPSVRVEDLSRNAIPNYQLSLPGTIDRCVANVFIDGKRMLSDDLSSIRPEEVVVIEVYPRKNDVPAEFRAPQSECGSVAVWTRQAFR